MSRQPRRPDGRLSPSEQDVAGPLMHYGFGIAVGAVYGALAETRPEVTRFGGVPFGLGVWASADEVAGAGRRPIRSTLGSSPASALLLDAVACRLRLDDRSRAQGGALAVALRRAHSTTCRDLHESADQNVRLEDRSGRSENGHPPDEPSLPGPPDPEAAGYHLTGGSGSRAWCSAPARADRAASSATRIAWFARASLTETRPDRRAPRISLIRVRAPGRLLPTLEAGDGGPASGAGIAHRQERPLQARR